SAARGICLREGLLGARRPRLARVGFLLLGLFFHCAGAHRELLSFPTRRSFRSPPAGCSSRRRWRRGCCGRCPAPRAARGRARARSEEHTSELQSRFDLVCRLLLEKKKTTIPTTGRASGSSPQRTAIEHCNRTRR